MTIKKMIETLMERVKLQGQFYDSLYNQDTPETKLKKTKDVLEKIDIDGKIITTISLILQLMSEEKLVEAYEFSDIKNLMEVNCNYNPNDVEPWLEYSQFLFFVENDTSAAWKALEQAKSILKKYDQEVQKIALKFLED